MDPDVIELVGSGSTQSQTVSQLGRILSCQMIVSDWWDLQLGDIRGAFLKADSLDAKKGLLYSSLPPGGIPGVSDDAVIFILGNVCGSHNAPQRWWKRFFAVMSSIGLSRSTRDVGVYAFRDTAGNLEGILCVNVDGTFCDGSDHLFPKALSTLRHRLPFRKWQVGEGMLCGSKYVQDRVNKEIMTTQTVLTVETTKVPMSPARRKYETILLTKLKSLRFVVLVAVSIGCSVK